MAASYLEASLDRLGAPARRPQFPAGLGGSARWDACRAAAPMEPAAALGPMQCAAVLGLPPGQAFGVNVYVHSCTYALMCGPQTIRTCVAII